MVFTGNASGSDKGQPRATLKARVQSRLQAALMPRRHNIESSTVITPSVPQSECSTLVEFATDHVPNAEHDSDEDDDDAGEYMLEADNRAWSTEKRTIKTTRDHAHVRVLYVAGTPLSQGHLLSAENTAWSAARPPASRPQPRSWFRSASHPPRVTSGIVAEMLDPEDRAWVKN